MATSGTAIAHGRGDEGTIAPARRRDHRQGWRVGILTRTYGDRQVAERLRRARLAAGFRSASAAATAHGWAPSSVHGHERGERALAPSDLDRYAAAYGADPSWIRAGTGAAPDEGPDRTGDGPASRPPHRPDSEETARIDLFEARTRHHFMAIRLGVARRLAAFPTASAACQHFGFNRSTYGVHEYGLKGPLPRVAAETYGAAFGVPASWLLLEGPPAAMPEAAAARVAEAEDAATRVRMHVKGDDEFYLRLVEGSGLFDACARWSDPMRRGSPSVVDALARRAILARPRARPTRPAAPVRLPEVSLDALDVDGPPRWQAAVRGHWSVPPDFVEGAEAGDAVVAVADADRPDLGLSAGDRLVIDVGPDPGAGRLLVRVDGRLRIVRWAGSSGDPAGDRTVLGRVVAAMSKAGSSCG